MATVDADSMRFRVLCRSSAMGPCLLLKPIMFVGAKSGLEGPAAPDTISRNIFRPSPWVLVFHLTDRFRDDLLIRKISL